MQVGDPAAANALAPTTIEYDAGRVSEVAQGNHVTRYEYDAAGRRTADRRRRRCARRARLRRRRPPDRDPLPGRAHVPLRPRRRRRADLAAAPVRAHAHVHADRPGRRRSRPGRRPAATGSYAIARDDDELATSVTTPTGAVRTIGTDAAGRVTGAAFPAVGRSVTYVPGVDRIGRYESTAAPGSAVQSLEPEFDGMRVTKLTAGGLAPAETTWAYGASLRMTSSRLVSGRRRRDARLHARRRRACPPRSGRSRTSATGRTTA